MRGYAWQYCLEMIYQQALSAKVLIDEDPQKKKKPG
jgi:hypothetical protein